MSSTSPEPQDQLRQPTGEDEGSGPPYRAIAMVLLAAVVVAVVAGLIQLFDGQQDSGTSVPVPVPSSQQVASGVGPSAGGEGTPASGQLVGQPGIVSTAVQPTSPPPAPGGIESPGVNPAEIPVRVFNNSNVTGLAGRTGDTLRGSGFNVRDVSNLPSSQGVVPESAAYYGTGAGEQQAAEAIAARLGIKAMPRPVDLDMPAPGVVVIVTQDLQR